MAAFLYGCHSPLSSVETRIFPYLISKLNAHFDFKSCRFVNQKAKETTARIALWRMLEIPFVYTLEASFFGPRKPGAPDPAKQAQEGRHFAIQDYLDIGRDVCLNLLQLMRDEVRMKQAEMVSTPEVRFKDNSLSAAAMQ